MYKSLKTSMKKISNRTYLFITIIIMLFVVASCTHNPLMFSDMPLEPPIIDTSETSEGIPCDPDTSYFVNDVLPILISNCAISGCHDQETHEEGIILNTYFNVMASDVVKPGDANNSDMIEAIIESDLDDRMPPPPAPPLSSDELAILKEWINQGAKNNSCGEECDTLNVTYVGSIQPILSSNCLGCHDANPSEGAMDLTNYDGVAAVAADGRLYGALNHDPGFEAMPLDGDKLSDCKIDKIRIWIEEGYLNN